jgi:hypothetical protein
MLTLFQYLGPDAKDLLTRLLRKEPSKRLGGTTTKDIKTLKSHRFFRKIDFKKLEKRELEPPIKPLITDPELAENFDMEFTGLPLSPVVTRSSRMFDDRMSESQIVAEENNRKYLRPCNRSIAYTPQHSEASVSWQATVYSMMISCSILDYMAAQSHFILMAAEAADVVKRDGASYRLFRGVLSFST